ncbi:DUF7344 domain-containing protein [Halocatena marina]|uniref:DUF7344 domain-containing protein n=1 Tax=Halocatena marina TaxID=2934937 RepID=A0ABD5YVF3_9EURY|nr:hypothetical protein [Halocatena marina]
MNQQYTQVTASTANESAESELSKDTLFHLLGNRRRRWVIKYLTCEHRAELGELAEQVAAREQGIPVEQVTAQQRKRVYTSLQQTHLPALDEAGVIDFETARGTIEMTKKMQELDIYLEVVPERTIPWSMYYLGIGIVSCAVIVTTAIIDAWPFTAIPALGWALLISLTVTISGAIHTYRTRTMRLDRHKIPQEVQHRP